MIMKFLFMHRIMFHYTLNSETNEIKAAHQIRNYKQGQLLQLCALSDHERFRNYLKSILIPRPVGSQNHKKVQAFITQSLEALGYKVESTTFTQQTVVGQKTFTNIVGTLDPLIPRRLILACHYDSKDFRPNFEFFGATDSAVPCAMLLDIAASLRNVIYNRKSKDLTLQLIFFDGEESFREWSDTDSLYGSRYMVKELEKRPYPQYYSPRSRDLDRIDLFVLLDLIGAKGSTFYYHHPYSVLNAYTVLPETERQLKAFQNCIYDLPTIFHDLMINTFIQDDHLPFLEKGVRTLHLIATPFPSEWHTVKDNEEILHFPTIHNILSILRVFTAKYLNAIDISCANININSYFMQLYCERNFVILQNSKSVDGMIGINDKGSCSFENKCDLAERLDNLFKRIANIPEAFLRDQQRGEADFTFEQRLNIVRSTYEQMPVKFLSKYSVYIEKGEVDLFEPYSDQTMEYHIERIKNSGTNEAAFRIKNRRFSKLKQLISEGTYFSDREMRQRDPWLYYHMIGRHLTENESKALFHSQNSQYKFSDLLLDFHDNKMVNDERVKMENSYRKEAKKFFSYETKKTETTISEEEKERLRKEFVTIMHESFLEGRDKEFDYSEVDENSKYDDYVRINQDAEDKYFEDSDD
ncbi:Glutaminyl-peptide cyclotransferase-like protein [Trichinella papuae]|uniref:Glutaminyl-peptide cyclotransferase n=1 Tax=Trichinella papuae TaxID=268474 RepID=A0A0V1MZE6_9BILA|nr:Glutaminyl-peptide cyclotransferase-like protein [Trichinella papuae]KRZ77145.1 Glutaminyl-peptide cyclotransferase-like protein [Trichinella papuae]